jgi:hypothetical protein
MASEGVSSPRFFAVGQAASAGRVDAVWLERLIRIFME